MTRANSVSKSTAPRLAIPAGAVESHWQTGDGHAVRRIDIAARASSGQQRGSILFMPGRADCYEKWFETLDHWAGEGWSVTSSDWRGQSLSGRLGSDRTTGHIDNFDTWVADYARLWSVWQAQTPGPHAAVAHSMGGNIVLRAVAEGKVRPDALILSAPMLGLHPIWASTAMLRPIAALICRLGDETRPAWKTSERPEILPRARVRLLTHDLERYADEQAWYEARPGLAMGPASWGWVAQALASIAALEKPGVLEGVELPVLLFGTSVDGLVSWPAIRRAAARLPKGELLRFGPEAAHEILREVDPVRDKALAAIEDFLSRVLPARG